MKNAQRCGLLMWRMGHETHNVTLRKLGKKGQFVCDLVKKSGGGGARFFFREGGSISKGGHVSSFERGGPLAWGGGGMLSSHRCLFLLPPPNECQGAPLRLCHSRCYPVLPNCYLPRADNWRCSVPLTPATTFYKIIYGSKTDLMTTHGLWCCHPLSNVLTPILLLRCSVVNSPACCLWAKQKTDRQFSRL